MPIAAATAKVVGTADTRRLSLRNLGRARTPVPPNFWLWSNERPRPFQILFVERRASPPVHPCPEPGCVDAGATFAPNWLNAALPLISAIKSLNLTFQVPYARIRLKL